MKRLLSCAVIAVLSCAVVEAQSGHDADSLTCSGGFRIENTKARPTVRLGWGDMMFETANWYKSSSTSDYRYVGHFFSEFQYPLLDWLGIGLEADWSSVHWNTAAASDRYFANICVIPTIRFTYYRKGRVEMYSGLGYGFNFNTGTEQDYKGRYTAAAPVIDLTLYGISVGCERWFASFELGGLASMGNMKKELYMLGSRLFSVSIGYRL